MKIEGHNATLMYGYAVVASLPKCVWVGDHEGFTAKGEHGDIDEMWLDSTPLDFVVPVGESSWRWRGVTVERNGPEMIIKGKGEPNA